MRQMGWSLVRHSARADPSTSLSFFLRPFFFLPPPPVLLSYSFLRSLDLDLFLGCPDLSVVSALPFFLDVVFPIALQIKIVQPVLSDTSTGDCLVGSRNVVKLYLQRKCMTRYLTAPESPDPHTSLQNTPFLLTFQAWLDQDLNLCFNALLPFMTFKGRPSKCLRMMRPFLLTFQNGQSNKPSPFTH